ncbi:protein LURP-one-related 8-like [Magnolia sinica]|uniref:protein LURP-one-related 8-like n=1 Tax=Magnolia sinica TaxID=86752 RepID=UPI002659C934|nr:protein LURP-one-related 8-like [Magnolia sinica]
MPKVHPNTVSEAQQRQDSDRHVAEALTVWKKSLLFNCNGFTVFDAKGNLAFRVDNYVADNNGQILLMDGGGKPLLTIRRKRLSLGDHWQIFNGEEDINPRLSVKKNSNFLNSKPLALVTSACGPRQVIYTIDGSYAQRCCVIYNEKRRPVAEIKCKETVGGASFGLDVFRLIIQPEFDMPIAMSLVIILEQMFRSRRFIY